MLIAWLNFLYLAAAIVFIILGYSIYRDIQTAKNRRSKILEYAAILSGCVVMYILLTTVWVSPVNKLGTAIAKFENERIWGRPTIENGGVNEVLPWTGNLSLR